MNKDCDITWRTFQLKSICQTLIDAEEFYNKQTDSMCKIELNVLYKRLTECGEMLFCDLGELYQRRIEIESQR